MVPPFLRGVAASCAAAAMLPAAASAATVTSPVAPRTVFGSFDIQVNFTGGTVSQQQAFRDAEAYWESQILGYESQLIADAMTAFAGGVLSIDADLSFIDGAGGVLGQAGADTVIAAFGGTPDAFMVATTGTMQFDSADVAALEAAGEFEDLILHEMAHVIGFSDFFWAFVGAIEGAATFDSGDVFTGDTSYTGPIALATYQHEFDPGATFVPIEESGGEGTAGAHWDEVAFAGHGNALNPELMTGFLNVNPTISRTTIASFDDLGYVTQLNAATKVPLPPAGMMLLAGVFGLGGLRRLARARTA